MVPKGNGLSRWARQHHLVSTNHDNPIRWRSRAYRHPSRLCSLLQRLQLMDDGCLTLDCEHHANLHANLDPARRRLDGHNDGNPALGYRVGQQTRYRDETPGIAGVTHRCIMAASLNADLVDRSEDTLERCSTNRYHAHSCLRVAHLIQPGTVSRLFWQSL